MADRGVMVQAFRASLNTTADMALREGGREWVGLCQVVLDRYYAMMAWERSHLQLSQREKEVVVAALMDSDLLRILGNHKQMKRGAFQLVYAEFAQRAASLGLSRDFPDVDLGELEDRLRALNLTQTVALVDMVEIARAEQRLAYAREPVELRRAEEDISAGA